MSKKIITFGEFKNMDAKNQDKIFGELKAEIIELNLTGSEIKQFPVRFMSELGLAFPSFNIIETRVSSSKGTLGTIGVTCDTELELGKGTNSNRNINWEEVVNVLTSTLTTSEQIEVEKSVKDGLKRTLKKAIWLLGSQQLLENPEKTKELLGGILNKGLHVQNTYEPLLDRVEVQLVVKK